MHISVLGLMLALVRHVDQIFETLTIGIACHQSIELILVELNQLPDRLGESIE